MSALQASRYNQAELAECARTTVAILQTLSAFRNERIIIIGGMAVSQYHKNRDTEDVDFLITADLAPTQVKETLSLVSSHYATDGAGVFRFTLGNGKSIGVDFVPLFQAPYVPHNMEVIKSVDLQRLPFISRVDLVATKINCCGLRFDAAKQMQDADDAIKLLTLPSQVVSPNENQRNAVLPGLAFVITRARFGQTWWRARLGL